MGNADATGSPLRTATDAAGTRATETFKLVSNETRLAILLALWEAYDPHADGNAVSFTELRDSVGVGQGRQFNYHLDKLVGEFVRKTDAGYVLRRTGLLLVQSIIAGRGIEDPTLEPTEVDATCPSCGGPTAVTYQNVNVYQVCMNACDATTGLGEPHPEGAFIGWTFEPTGLADRTAAEVFAASTIKTFARIALRTENICPDCSGPVRWTLDVCAAHEPDGEHPCPACGRTEPIQVRETCTVCKSAGQGSPSIKTMLHPAVIAFYYDHGIEVGFTGATGFADVIRMLELAEDAEESIVDTDPVRLQVTFTQGGDQLRLLVDEDLNVLETSRDGPAG